MATTTFDIDITPILALPVAQKLAISEAIWASIEEGLRPAPQESAEFLAEQDRRLAELRANPSIGVPWEVVRAAAAARRRK